MPFREAPRHRRTTPCRAGSARLRAGVAAARRSGLRWRASQYSCGRITRSAEDRRAAAGFGARVELAAKIPIRMLPVRWRRDLLVPLIAHRAVRHIGLEVGGAADDVGLAGFFQKYSGADRLLDAGAAKHYAVIAEQHGEGLPERTRDGFALALQRDQRHVGLVPRHLGELIGVERIGLQRLRRR